MAIGQGLSYHSPEISFSLFFFVCVICIVVQPALPDIFCFPTYQFIYSLGGGGDEDEADMWFFFTKLSLK